MTELLGALLLRRASIERLLAPSPAQLAIGALWTAGCGAVVGGATGGARALGLALTAGVVLWLLVALLGWRRPERPTGWLALMLACGPLELLALATVADPLAAVGRDSLLLALAWGWRAVLATRAAGVAGVGAIQRHAGVAGLASIGGGVALFAWHYRHAGQLMTAAPRTPLQQAHMSAAYNAAVWLLLVVPIAIAASLAMYIMLRDDPATLDEASTIGE